MITVINSQPLSRSRAARAPIATSRLRVAKLTEMNAPIDMMNSTTPMEPNIRPTVSVETNPVSGCCSPYRPFTGDRISC